MSSRDVLTYSGGLRRRERKVICPHGEEFVLPYRQEKGVDVRIALDAIHAARTRSADVLLIFSQDQDLAEVAMEVREIARAQRQWIKVASTFPVGPGTTNRRGIDRTDWIEIDRDLYDMCIDPLDYRRHDLGAN